MHRLAASLLLASALFLVPAPAARAQGQDAVSLTLVGQTPWNSFKQPVLEVEFRALNSGSVVLDQLSIGITLWTAVRSRSAYELSLASDPSPAVPIHGEVQPQKGTLAPGADRRLSFTLDLTSFPGLSTDQSLIYPLRVDLRSAGVPVAVLRTPVVFLVKKPLVPLTLAWTFVLHTPILFGPGGTFRTDGLEQSLARGGRLAGEINALRSLLESPGAKPVDVVVSPTLLVQLERMRAGYTVESGGQPRHVAAGRGGAAAAAEALVSLKAIAGEAPVELSAFPFAAPDLPSITADGLAHDLAIQLQRGREEVSADLGAEPDPSVLHPPGSAIDQTSLDTLARQGVTLVLPDPSAVPQPPQPLGFAPPATASLEAAGSTVTAVVPDQSVEALLSSPTIESDPVLGAQAVLGELAAIWLEQPSIPRGLAVTIPETLPFPGAFFGPLVRGIAGAPWLRPETATALAEAFPPSGEPAHLVPTGTGSFAPTYVDSFKAARREIDTFRSILVGPGTQADELETMLLLSESGEYVDLPGLGLQLITSVRQTLSDLFAKVHPDTGQPVTLSSSHGLIPVRVTNGTGQALRVIVELVSPHLRFTQGASQGPIELSETDAVLNFGVQLQTTGRFPVQVLVESPSGRVVSQGTLIVRSTAYNRVALLITVGAAIVLLGLWARRFVPRTKS